MEIYVIRHSIANSLGAEGTTRDEDRALTKDGIERIEAVAKGLKAMGIAPEYILTSPYLRALQTAQALQKGLGLTKNFLVQTPNLAITGNPEQVMEEVNLHYPAVKQIFLVGHEPGLTELIGLLVSGNPNLGLKVGRASVTCLHIHQPLESEAAELAWKMTAKQVSAFGERS
jgi:phosphohistidine phosphatase